MKKYIKKFEKFHEDKELEEDEVETTDDEDLDLEIVDEDDEETSDDEELSEEEMEELNEKIKRYYRSKKKRK